eukprot:1157214-Pelagomonas_calceolata.AAC.5
MDCKAEGWSNASEAVDNPEQYSFDRPGLMESVLSLLVLLASVSYKDAGKAFVQAIAQEPDLDLGVLNQVCAVSALCFEEVTSLPRCGQGPCYSIRTQSGSESAEPGAVCAQAPPMQHQVGIWTMFLLGLTMLWPDKVS